MGGYNQIKYGLYMCIRYRQINKKEKVKYGLYMCVRYRQINKKEANQQ